MLILFKHKLNCLWGRTPPGLCNTECAQTQGFLWAGKDWGITAWMLNSFIISTMSKHHFVPQEDPLINVINIILPGLWGSGCVRPGVPEAPADTEKGKRQQSYPSRNLARTPSLPHCLRGLQLHLNLCSLAGIPSPASLGKHSACGRWWWSVYPAEISKPNSGNLCCSHITGSLTPEKSSSNKFFVALLSLFLFSQHNKATPLTRAGEIDLIWFCFD